MLVFSRRHKGTESFIDHTMDESANSLLPESLAKVQRITAPVSFSFISVSLCLCERLFHFFSCRTFSLKGRRALKATGNRESRARRRIGM